MELVECGNQSLEKDQEMHSGIIINGKPKNIVDISVNPHAILDAENKKVDIFNIKDTLEAITCCQNLYDDGNKLCNIFMRDLKRYYQHITLPKVAWLQEGRDLSITDCFIQLKLIESKKEIKIEQIFNSRKKETSQRILIEGQPGFGKTTLALRIAHDWAVNKRYMSKFELVFFVPVRELAKRSFEDAILEIGRRCDFSDSMYILNNHKKKSLFILDGLDEIVLENRRQVLQILFKQYYSNVTVVAFARTGLLKLTQDERSLLFGMRNFSNTFYDKRISILGIASEIDKQKFLTKFLRKSSVENAVQCLSAQWAMFDSPLLLMALLILLSEEEEGDHFANKTRCFKELFNSIIKHNLVKRELSFDSDFDLFCVKSSPTAVQQCVKRFGLFALQNIIQSTLRIDCDDLTNEIYELGFLVKYIETTMFKVRYYYESWHLSIMEFAAAYAFWMILKYEKFTAIENELELIFKHYFQTEGTSLILPFLVNLMEDDLDLLLSQIESFSVRFSADYKLTKQLFSECSPTNTSKSKYLKYFLLNTQINSTPKILRNNEIITKNGRKCDKLS